MKKAFKIFGIILLILIASIFIFAPFITSEINNAFRLLEKGLEASTVDSKINYQKQYYDLIKMDKVKSNNDLLKSIETMDKNLKLIDSKISNTIYFIEDSIIAIYSANDQEHTTKYLVGEFSFNKCSGEIIAIADLLQHQENFILTFNKDILKNSYSPYIMKKDGKSDTITKPTCEFFHFMAAIPAIGMLKKHRLDQYDVALNQLDFIKNKYNKNL